MSEILPQDICRGTIVDQIINAWKALKCGAGEGWRRSV